MDAGDFSGSWSYDLQPGPDGGTLLTITEGGRVANPLFRALVAFQDEHPAMLRVHGALGARLGEQVEPEPLPNPLER